MELTYSGLEDLYSDWLTAIPETQVSLRKMKIYRIYGIENGTADVTVTDVCTMKQKRAKAHVPIMWAEKLEHSGVFYKTSDEKRFIPSDEVNGHVMSDYFDFRVKDLKEKNREEKEAADLVLAGKFRKADRIVFIARRSVKGYAELVGMKSVCASNKTRLIDVAGVLNKKRELTFFSDYPDQTEPALDFVFRCGMDSWRTSDGTLYRLTFKDCATGRRSSRVDVTAEINGRSYVIDSMEISHRTAASAETLANRVITMAEKHQHTTLNPAVDARTVAGECVKHVPKKTREKVLECIMNRTDRPIEAAYDVIGSGVFNPGRKQHRTQSYDGGRRKYELALGSALKTC